VLKIKPRIILGSAGGTDVNGAAVRERATKRRSVRANGI